MRCDYAASTHLDRLAQAQKTQFVPSVILGSKKVEKSREWPYAVAYLSLEERMKHAATVVIAGYSFRDVAVNSRLRNALIPEKRWIVIDYKQDDVSAGAFQADVRDVIANAEIEFVMDGFAGALPDVPA